MNDLISREAALEAVKIPNGEYSNPSERHGIIIARVEALRRIMAIPSVEAVPLNALCAWLEANCLYDPNYELPSTALSAEMWETEIKMMMEEQNAR